MLVSVAAIFTAFEFFTNKKVKEYATKNNIYTEPDGIKKYIFYFFLYLTMVFIIRFTIGGLI